MRSVRTGDQNLLKQINKSIVFQAIKNNGPVSRAQISKGTGLNKATVSTMVSELIKESLVQEIGSGQSSGGRKPVMLYFNHHAGYSIGIDLGVNYCLGILTDLSGHIVEKQTIKLSDTAFDYVTKQIKNIIANLMKKAPESTYGIVGIGIGVPAQVDENHNIIFAPNLKWKNVDLKTEIEEHFQIPTIIENEANAGSHGEHIFGAGKNISNIVYASLGIGIGTGIIINNQLYRGTSGISGEMGHMTIDANGRKCSCGNRGCWELYASENALLLAAKKLNLSEDKSIQLEFLLKEAKKGNPKVIQLLNTLGEKVGTGIVNVINTFNPEMVIIGNRLAQFESWIINPMKRTLDERLSIYHKKSTEIRFSVLGIYSTALGANSFSISNFFMKLKINEARFVM